MLFVCWHCDTRILYGVFMMKGTNSVFIPCYNPRHVDKNIYWVIFCNKNFIIPIQLLGFNMFSVYLDAFLNSIKCFPLHIFNSRLIILTSWLILFFRSSVQISKWSIISVISGYISSVGIWYVYKNYQKFIV